MESSLQPLFDLNAVDVSWRQCLVEAMSKMDQDYLQKLSEATHWLPGQKNIFNAFSLPVDKTQYVLFGESPYPREHSANGYAFWDAAVKEIWSDTGLSKPVNRATSLRNIIKMLLIAEKKLDPLHTTQPDIANIDKTNLVKTNTELFQNFIQHGFLLLNATLVLQPKQVQKDADAWVPFIQHTLNFLFKKNPDVKLILFGNIAKSIEKLVAHHQGPKLFAEHPYNISFISNPKVLDFFRPLHLLIANSSQKSYS